MDSETAEQRDKENCHSKLTFASKELAEAAKAYAAWQYGQSKTVAYNCKYCSQWHLARAIG